MQRGIEGAGIPAAALLLAAAGLLAACGGGGGPGGGPGMEPRCIATGEGCLSPAAFDSRADELAAGYRSAGAFSNQWGLAAIRADRAYAHLELAHGAGTEPGSGVTVGVIDSGIDPAHPAFAGTRVSEVFLHSALDETGDRFSHGTAVASVIAGRPDAAFAARTDAAHGIAWAADIAMFAIPTGMGEEPYLPVSPAWLAAADDDWVSTFRRVLDWSDAGRSIDFVNLSVGFPGIVEGYGERELRDSFGRAIAALAQEDADDRTVFVWAAGNGHGRPCDAANFPGVPGLCVDGQVVARSVEVQAGLAARIAELRGHVIAVVAVDEEGAIAPFSNRCGIAARWCLAAPGVGVQAAWFGPHPGDGSPGVRGTAGLSGTSVAAPMVTGGLAVMKHRFRGQLSNTALAARLLATADRTGIHAESAIYGQGMMDLAAATAPVGAPRIARGGRVDGAAADLAESRLVSGGAFGDGLERALAGQEVAAFDDLGAPFWYPLGDFAGVAAGPSLAARLRGFMARSPPGHAPATRRVLLGAVEADDRNAFHTGLRAGLLEPYPPGGGNGHLSLAGRAPALEMAGQSGLTAAAFTNEGTHRWRSPVSGAVLSWRPGGMPAGVRGGWLAEREALLGGTASGAFGRLSARSAFAGLEGSKEVGAWQFNASAEIGTVHAATGGGLLAGLSPLTTSAFDLRAARRLAGGDILVLSVSQPLRIEDGRARLSIPEGRTRDGQVVRRPLSAGLVPSGRQIEVAVQWRRPLAVGAELRLGGSWTRQRDHIAAAAPEFTFLAGLSFGLQARHR